MVDDATADDDGMYDDLEEFQQSLEVLVIDSMPAEELWRDLQPTMPRSVEWCRKAKRTEDSIPMPSPTIELQCRSMAN